ncbi:MAG TPA: pimeloyl-ACP methyl ester esterase BioH [Sideroxyarcus sp.]|nr:pimeloyl-ACP methyl ester esterase BioH [Sideroxyarcus sp.]
MSLHVETLGCGAPLVLLHGWGMHGGVWSDVAARLAEDFQVHSVDLPGHGASAPLAEMQLDALVQTLSARFAEPVSVCGWSLGGQVAMHWAARRPEQVRRLLLVASTPCFAERADWTYGMAQDVLAKFAAELEQNHAATLRRFIALQLRGSENERELLALLRERLFSRGEPDMAALRAGLDILRDADLRGELPDIRQPVLLVAGERDKLTLPQASRYMAQALPAARMVEVEGAAHAPFLSHPEIFVGHVKSFLHE